MRLTRYTDYALRVLMHVGLNEGELVRVSDIADSFGISRNHLTKIVHQLGTRGYLQTMQGRRGGIRLACSPSKIVIGKVVRDFEEDFILAECFSQNGSKCCIQPACILRGTFDEALAAFLEVLDGRTLTDLLKPHRHLRALLEIGGGSAAHQSVPTSRPA